MRFEEVSTWMVLFFNFNCFFTYYLCCMGSLLSIFYKNRVWLVFWGNWVKEIELFKKEKAAALTDCTERRNAFLTFCKCRFGIKWPDNHGLYGLSLHSVGSCSIYGKPPYRTSRKPSRSKALEIPGWRQESCRLLRIAPISFKPKGVSFFVLLIVIVCSWGP